MEKRRDSSIIIKKSIKVLLALVLLVVIFLLGLTLYVSFVASKHTKIASDIPKTEVALVLGCGTIDGKPSPMLKSRLDKAIELYKNGSVEKLLLTGYKSGKFYDEVETMKAYCKESGVLQSDILEDKKGDDTFLSISNIVDSNNVSSFVIVTQKWHLYRAIFIADNISDDVFYGVKADDIEHQAAMHWMNTREVLARVKAVVDILKYKL